MSGAGQPLGRRGNTAATTCKNNDLRGPKISRFGLQRIAKRLLPDERSLQCCHATVSHQSEGSAELIWQREQTADGYEDRAYFSGIHRCGSVWLCPVCAHAVAAGRRNELNAAQTAAGEHGFGLSFVTQTIRHGADMPLSDTLERLADARRRLTSWRAFKELAKRYGRIGEIRALEVTHGQNGWHPHLHMIWFHERALSAEDRQALQAELFDLWRKSCGRAGLPLPNEAHGVTVQAGNAAADYTSKWGFADELTRSQTKQGKGKGRTPWELLRDAADDGRAAWLWREYAAAFKGRRQLFWSRGLREKLGLSGEKSDGEMLQLELERAQLADVPERDVIYISEAVWWLIDKAGGQEWLLQTAKAEGPDAARRLIQAITGGRRFYERGGTDWRMTA